MAGADRWSGDPFTIVWIPDTHVPILGDAKVFPAMTAWIAANAATLNIQFVGHVGDVIMTAAEAAQWAAADAAWDTIDTAEIPYLIAPGNHDYNDLANRTATGFNANFGPTRYTAHDWWTGGFFEEGKADNAYLLATISGQDYIFLALEVFPRQAVIDWAATLLTTHAARHAIIITHAYLSSVQDRRITDPDDVFSPDDYDLTDAHDGVSQWAELYGLHDNLVWVQCGHLHGSLHMTTLRTGGYSCHQSMFDATDYPDSGGWIQLMTITPATGLVRVQSYCPGLDQYDTDANHDFTLTYHYHC